MHELRPIPSRLAYPQSCSESVTEAEPDNRLEAVANRRLEAVGATRVDKSLNPILSVSP